MGQRLDRNTSNQTLVNNPVNSSSNVNNVNNSATNNNVTSSSSSSSSSTSSSTMPHFSSSARPRNSRSSGQIANSQQTPSTNNRELSPRARLRSEMARQGMGSSDLFLRLFQLQSPPNSTSSSSAANQSSNALRLFNFGSSGTPANPTRPNNNDIDDLNSDLSSDEDEPHWNHNLNSLAQSLPFFLGMRDLKCFVCNKMIPADDVEAHIMMCLTKPRLTYNEDVLQSDDKGECIICLELLEQGQTIARLPCLCIYHKTCIDNWFQRSQSCPNHPTD